MVLYSQHFSMLFCALLYVVCFKILKRVKIQLIVILNIFIDFLNYVFSVIYVAIVFQL